jgi:16S rRNA (cytosine967-C5)-methyltransferase
LLQQEADAPTTAPDEYPVLVQLVRGVLERREVLDDVLAPLLPKGLESLPKPVLQTLRLGAYQILFLERVKKRDVVFEAVELTKGGKFKGLAKLVNAVLRRVEPASGPVGSDVRLAASRNFPEWLVARWKDQFGEDEVECFCEANNKPLPLYFRVNTARTSREKLQKILRSEGVIAEPARFSEESLCVQQLPKAKRVQNLESYRKGLFFVQDLSSTLVADIATREIPQSVCDLCAAPGGKSCSMALSIVERSGAVMAFDRTEKRVGLIQDAVTRLGLPNIAWSIRDAAQMPPADAQTFDAVLVDAPCSGFGTLGRKIDARWSKSEDTIRELSEIQSTMLASAAHLVKSGGILVYSTCTIERAENEDVVTSFLENHADFTIVDLSSELSHELCTPEGFYRAWPHRHAMAGAFAAKLRRR